MSTAILFKSFKPIQGLSKSFLILNIIMISILNLMQASSHREAPLIANDPLADNTDLYAFRSPDDPNMITIIANYVPLQLPHGGPNYASFGEHIRYEIHIDNDASISGDEVTYRFTFSKVNEDPTTFFNVRLGAQNLKTSYTLEKSIDGGLTFFPIIVNGVVPPPYIGDRSIESAVGLNTTYDALVQQAIMNATTGEKVYAGPADDPFFVDLGGVFDLGDAPREAGDFRDGVACYNVSSIVIQVPISGLLKSGAPTVPTNILDADYVIGVWASASRRSIRTLTAGGETHSGDWIQVSRLGMPLTNEVVIPIGQKDFWNSLTPYDEISETTLDENFYNPELALYMDDDLFGTAVPSFTPLRIQRDALQSFDFGNGNDGLFGLKGSPAVAGTALDDAIFGTLLLPAAAKPRSVDLWPIFHTGVPNFPPYQLATGKAGNPLAAGKPFINNFLPNGGDMLRLNMAVPVTDRNDPNFSSLGLISAAVLGLTDPTYASDASLQFIPNMDGFPNGRRLEDDVTRIELQAVGGAVLAAIGLWYDDYTAGDPNPVTQQLLDVLTFSTGVEHNDLDFKTVFPYVAMPHTGTGECSGRLVEVDDNGNDNTADLELSISTPNNTYGQYEKVPYEITIFNNGPTTATDISVSAGLPDGMVYSNDETDKGDYNLFFERWDVGVLESGESATLTLTLFTLVENISIDNFVQVLASSKIDPDSTPGNDVDNTPDEDDEAAVSIQVNDLLPPSGPNQNVLDGINNVEVFPNPVNEVLTVEFEISSKSSNTLFIYDLTGRPVITEKVNFEKGFNQIKVETDKLPAGSYFLFVPTTEGKSLMSRFIKG